MEKDLNIYTIRGYGLHSTMMYREQIDYWERLNPFQAGNIIQKYISKKIKETKHSEHLKLYIKGMSFIVFPGERDLYTERVCVVLFYTFYKSIIRFKLP